MGFHDTPCSGLPNVKWDWCYDMAALVQNMGTSVAASSNGGRTCMKERTSEDLNYKWRAEYSA